MLEKKIGSLLMLKEKIENVLVDMEESAEARRRAGKPLEEIYQTNEEGEVRGFKYIELVKTFKNINMIKGWFYKVNVHNIDSPKTGLRNLTSRAHSPVYSGEDENAIYFNLVFSKLKGDDNFTHNVGGVYQNLRKLHNPDLLVEKVKKYVVRKEGFDYGEETLTFERSYLSNKEKIDESKHVVFHLDSNNSPLYEIEKIRINGNEKRVILDISKF